MAGYRLVKLKNGRVINEFLSIRPSVALDLLVAASFRGKHVKFEPFARAQSFSCNGHLVICVGISKESMRKKADKVRFKYKNRYAE